MMQEPPQFSRLHSTSCCIPRIDLVEVEEGRSNNIPSHLQPSLTFHFPTPSKYNRQTSHTSSNPCPTPKIFKKEEDLIAISQEAPGRENGETETQSTVSWMMCSARGSW